MFFEKCIAVAHDGAEQNQKVQVILVLTPNFLRTESWVPH